MKTFAIYCRVSTTEQTTSNQTLQLEAYCKKNDYSFQLFEEVESTRKTRPIKQRLLNELRKRKYDGVLVYKLDRWARSSRELILDIEELTERGVQFISFTENLDFGTSIGKLHFGILSVFADFERSLISERTKQGLLRAKAEGKTLGRPKGSKDKKQRKKSGYYLRNSLRK